MATLADDQYADCDVCSERYWGAAAARYLREIDEPDGETRLLCLRCLKHRAVPSED